MSDVVNHLLPAESGGYRTGETGLIAEIPEAEPVVGAWRSQFDSAAAAGIPAHITVLYPFLDRDSLDDVVLAELGALVGAQQAFDLRLLQTRRFPGVLYLAPDPDAGLRALTHAIAARWPEAPPYGGQFADVVPHLTIAHGQEPQVLDMIEADVCGRLPVATRIASVQLMAYDGSHWIQLRSFLLATRAEGRELPGVGCGPIPLAGITLPNWPLPAVLLVRRGGAAEWGGSLEKCCLACLAASIFVSCHENRTGERQGAEAWR